MPQINQLPTRKLQAGDLLPFFSSANGDAAKTSMTAIAALVAELNAHSPEASQTRFGLAVQPANELDYSEAETGFWLILAIAGSGTLELRLPSVTDLSEGTEIRVAVIGTGITQTTWLSTDATFDSAIPVELQNDHRFTIKYTAVEQKWYLVGAAAEMFMPENPFPPNPPSP